MLCYQNRNESNQCYGTTSPQYTMMDGVGNENGGRVQAITLLQMIMYNIFFSNNTKGNESIEVKSNRCLTRLRGLRAYFYG